MLQGGTPGVAGRGDPWCCREGPLVLQGGATPGVAGRGDPWCCREGRPLVLQGGATPGVAGRGDRWCCREGRPLVLQGGTTPGVAAERGDPWCCMEGRSLVLQRGATPGVAERGDPWMGDPSLAAKLSHGERESGTTHIAKWYLCCQQCYSDAIVQLSGVNCEALHEYYYVGNE